MDKEKIKYALIGAIESEFNDTNVKTGICSSCKRRLESEAILCFENWRKNAGDLKDIPIYAVCPTKNRISDKTKRVFRDLNVIYIEEYKPIVETFTSGFLNIPLVGSMMEDRLKNEVDRFIKIDLDMNIIKPLPRRWLESDRVVVGQYDDYSSKHQRQGSSNNNPFDTGFIISKVDSGFYHSFFKKTMMLMNSEDPEWMRVKAQTGDYYLEEHVVDRMNVEDSELILPVQKYQVGEWYTPVNELTDKELEDVYFWHEHLEYDKEYDKIREKIAFQRRLAKK